VPRPLSVLFAIPSLAGGGAERVAATLLRHLDRERFAPALAAATLSGPLLADLPPDIPLHDLGSARASRAMPGLVALVRKTRPQVLFSTLGHLNLLVMLAKPFLGPRPPALVARETNIPSINLGQSPRPWLFKALYRLLYPRFDRVVCQSRDMQGDLVRHFGVQPERSLVIPNPVDAAALRARAGEAPRVLPEGVPNLVAAGKLLRQKGFDLLLAALARLPEPRPRLTILGQGPLLPDLEAQARDLGLAGLVHFAGFTDNPAPYFAQADLFVLSSRHEGFPNVVLEALALGTPVAAFRCPGGLDEIISPGENGWLAEPGDPASLAACLAQALARPLSPARVAASVEPFAAPAIARRYEALFSSLCPA
jgi:glycosyltransferase involved in cell wall biosynthesis